MTNLIFVVWLLRKDDREKADACQQSITLAQTLLICSTTDIVVKSERNCKNASDSEGDDWRFENGGATEGNIFTLSLALPLKGEERVLHGI